MNVMSKCRLDVMLCPYLRGHWIFGGYFFTKWVLLHRPFKIWCQLGQKYLFRGLASMEVGWPQLLWILILWQKSAGHAKFGHYRTSGSWVMSSVVQKTAHPPFLQIFYLYGKFEWTLTVEASFFISKNGIS